MNVLKEILSSAGLVIQESPFQICNIYKVFVVYITLLAAATVLYLSQVTAEPSLLLPCHRSRCILARKKAVIISIARQLPNFYFQNACSCSLMTHDEASVLF
jgi:hypothetical protein